MVLASIPGDKWGQGELGPDTSSVYPLSLLLHCHLILRTYHLTKSASVFAKGENAKTVVFLIPL